MATIGTSGSAFHQEVPEAEIRFTLDMIPTLAWSAEEDGFSYVNRRWREYTGLTPEQAQGWGWKVVIHPDDLEKALVRWQEIRQSKAPAEVELRLRRHDGVYRWFESHVTPYLDPQGNVLQWFGTFADIEDRKRAESQLKESEERHRLIVNSIPGMVSTWSPTGELEMVNQRLKDQLGLTLEELKDHSAAIHPEDRYHTIRTWRRSVRTGEPYDVEHRVRGADGRYRWFHTRGLPHRNPQGQIVGWSKLGTDIDDLKRADESLRRKSALLEHAERLTLTASFEWNATTNEFVWSRENYRMLEVDEKLKPSIDLIVSRIHPEDLTLWRNVVEQARRTGEDVDLEHRLLMPDGRVKHVRVVARATRSPAPGDLKYVCAVLDITDRKRAAEALRASEHLARGQVETLTQTLSSLAHESKPEKFLELVLTTISRQLGAHSIGAYDLDASTRVYPVANCEEETLHLITSDEAAAYPRLLLTSEAPSVWTVFLQKGNQCVVCDIREEPIRVRLAESADSPWQDWTWDESERWPSMKRQNAQGCVQILVVPMLVSGKVTGCLCIRFKEVRNFRPEEIALTRALAHQATLALQLIGLSRQSRQTAVEAERNRMARDIHDTLAQGFTGVILQLEAARGALEQGDVAGATQRIGQAGNLARVGLGEARRSVLALRPRSLEDASLQSALQDLLKRMTSGSGLLAEVHLVGEEPALPSELKEGLLRVTQESLTNTIRHANARIFRATMAFLPNETHLDLLDDGSGFDPGMEHEGFGLMGMRERIDQMGGKFSVSSAPGRGTEIRIVLPISPESKSGRSAGHA